MKKAHGISPITVDHSLLAQLRCDRLRVKVYLPSIDLCTVDMDALFQNTQVKITDFDEAMNALPSPLVKDKSISGHLGNGGKRCQTAMKRTYEFKAIGVYVEVDYLNKMIAVEYQGRYWSLATHPWKMVYNLTDWLKSHDAEGMAQVSRIDINRHFIGKPLELFPNPMSDRLHFGFLEEGSKPEQVEGNIRFQKSDTSRCLLYSKTHQLQKVDEDVAESFNSLLKEASVPEGASVSRFEVVFKGKGNALALASLYLKERSLGRSQSLQRIFCHWVRGHRVLQAPDKAKSLDKSRDYKRKKWKLSQEWKKLTTVQSSAPDTTPVKLDERIAPQTRPSQPKDKLKSQVRKTALEAIKRGVTGQELSEMMQQALFEMCPTAAEGLVAKDLTDRTLKTLSPSQRRAGDTPPEWMVCLLRPLAAAPACSSISRQASPQEFLKVLIERRKASWRTPYCPDVIRSYNIELTKVLRLMHNDGSET